MLEIGRHRRVGAWTLVPIELTVIGSSPIETSSYLYASKSPHAVVLVRDDGAHLVLDTEGREIPLAGLLAEMPGLKEELSRLRPATTRRARESGQGNM
ncbi:MAG TPA: hypothetical protein VLK65_10540 [Vicinamibacteria bacterium]|nr:hypothetical protein [Vicinamibacteria bacterium]